MFYNNSISIIIKNVLFYFIVLFVFVILFMQLNYILAIVFLILAAVYKKDAISFILFITPVFYLDLFYSNYIFKLPILTFIFITTYLALILINKFLFANLRIISYKSSL